MFAVFWCRMSGMLRLGRYRAHVCAHDIPSDKLHIHAVTTNCPAVSGLQLYAT